MACYTAYPRRSRNISTFSPRFPVADFTPFFRILDEEVNSGVSRHPIRSWQPRFDVREEKDFFQLQGELPGMEAQDISIELTDENTMVIKGRTVKESTERNEPETAKTNAAEKHIGPSRDGTASETGSSTYQKPSVEDEEYVEVDSEKSAVTPVTSEPGSTKTASSQEPVALASSSQPKYWVSERSDGEFNRSFKFPKYIDQDAVSASLKNGIINIIVPKAAAKDPKKINIE